MMVCNPIVLSIVLPKQIRTNKMILCETKVTIFLTSTREDLACLKGRIESSSTWELIWIFRHKKALGFVSFVCFVVV